MLILCAVDGSLVPSYRLQTYNIQFPFLMKWNESNNITWLDLGEHRGFAYSYYFLRTVTTGCLPQDLSPGPLSECWVCCMLRHETKLCVCVYTIDI